MDSLTHVVLGGAIGEIALGKKIGNKAIIVGAIANTIPDLDVFPQAMTKKAEVAIRIHRSYTHALFVHPFLALPFAYLTYRLFKKKIPFLAWYLLFVFSFFSHALIDCCTTYGTQLLLPFSNMLVSWNNLAVVDPLFTLPLILFFIAVWFFRKENNVRRYLGVTAIALSLIYLTSATVHKFTSVKVFRKALQEQQIATTHFSTTPAMFTSWLWSMVAYNDSTMYLAEYSVFQKTKNIDIVAIPRHTMLLQPLQNTKAVQTLKWFSQGNYFVENGMNDTLQFYNAKWGRGDFTAKEVNQMFPFYVNIYKGGDGEVTFKECFPSFTHKDFQRYFSMLRKRIFNE